MRVATWLIVDVGIVFAARMVIRFARLAPEQLDLRQVNRDLEALMEMFRTGEFHTPSVQVQS